MRMSQGDWSKRSRGPHRPRPLAGVSVAGAPRRATKRYFFFASPRRRSTRSTHRRRQAYTLSVFARRTFPSATRSVHHQRPRNPAHQHGSSAASKRACMRGLLKHALLRDISCEQNTRDAGLRQEQRGGSALYEGNKLPTLCSAASRPLCDATQRSRRRLVGVDGLADVRLVRDVLLERETMTERESEVRRRAREHAGLAGSRHRLSNENPSEPSASCTCATGGPICAAEAADSMSDPQPHCAASQKSGLAPPSACGQ